jgi:hypothetical protein
MLSLGYSILFLNSKKENEKITKSEEKKKQKKSYTINCKKKKTNKLVKYSK